ncbi:hypothetical protein F4821DRAFT_167027 [Hypoxylon rubiginosum]|uniref:Uncharacterized protein n=1 Tax=Hypoxylon rubiginosum TaxID=110542 RepID=A0ACC0CW01_9PEZI|nr:hypothetical protein F4821DRAFT_167027 [Hypoxylon rubiginosum]
MKFTIYTTLCAVFATAVVAQDFSGSGQIYVINNTDWKTATPDQSIGCLDARGSFSEDNCATFTKLGVYPNTLSTSVGNCSFTDSTQPANTDNAYGSHSYAWHCRPSFSATVTDSFYTIKGLPYPFLCHGDSNCFFDVKNLPTRNVTMPAWEYIWGSKQTSIPAGHTQVMFYWQKTA